MPETQPRIAVSKQHLPAGETLQANCTSGASHPAPNITWTLNGQPVSITSHPRTRLASKRLRDLTGWLKLLRTAPPILLAPYTTLFPCRIDFSLSMLALPRISFFFFLFFSFLHFLSLFVFSIFFRRTCTRNYFTFLIRCSPVNSSIEIVDRAL